MNPRAQALIEQLKLEPHPEGGHYREVFRSGLAVTRHSDSAQRTALTTIYFLLLGGESSSWHRVASDEIWHFYEGAELELFVSSSPGGACDPVMLGPVGNASSPVRVVPAGCWQMARTSGDYTLVGCTVGPGFEFADFELA